MSAVDKARAAELQNISAHAYQLARDAYQPGAAPADRQAAAARQEAAAKTYLDAAKAREAATGV